MVKKLFTRVITKEDIKREYGYDLTQMATIGGFMNATSAVNAWLDEAAESINDLILDKRGFEYAKRLNEYLTKAEETEDIYLVMYWAQMEEMRFFIDNGRFSSTGKIDPTRKKHSEEAIRLLYSVGILRDGVF